MTELLAWLIAAGTIAGVLFRPRNWPEAVWACLGAALFVAFGVLPLPLAAAAVAKGFDVYLFLTGMMLLSELARREGVFDWLASLAVRSAKGSGARLFALVYLVGIVVTVFLSNDATAVVLTPAVYAAVRRAKANVLPYLFSCAFIANAASFVLPISNPANLVVYGRNLPALLPWFRTFLLPSLCSIAVTYLALRWYSRRQIQIAIENGGEPVELSREGRWAAWGILTTGALLVGASAFQLDLGLPTCTAAIAVLLAVTRGRGLPALIGGVAWGVLPLVAGLFVMVDSLNHAGALNELLRALTWCKTMPPLVGALSASFGIAALSNVMNNLPAGLMAAGSLKAVSVSPLITNAVLIGVDLGPNLSVSGSLATVLWLIAIRREGVNVSPWQFLKVGVLVMTPALLLAACALRYF